jgi:hypothetical protein
MHLLNEMDRNSHQLNSLNHTFESVRIFDDQASLLTFLTASAAIWADDVHGR